MLDTFFWDPMTFMLAHCSWTASRSCRIQDLVTVKVTEVHYTSFHVYETNFRGFLLCDTIYFGHTWSADILSYSVINIIDWKDDIPYTIYNTNSSSLDCWHRAGWIHVFMLQMPNFGLAICRLDHIFSILNCLVLVSLCPLKSQSCVLGWQDTQSGTQSGHLLL